MLQKKRKAPANTDFKPLKHKVGRRAPAPANATDTSFKSKQVVIREQSVAADKSSAGQVASRKQTVEQLTSLTQHHHQRVRAEAFAGLQELAERRAPQVQQDFARHLPGLCKAMADAEPEVRAGFRATLARLCVTGQAWLPMHLDSLLKHATAALTSAEGVGRRLDATLVVEVLAEAFPSALQAAAPGLVPLYADLCRSVLGTSTSSLAKGSGAPGAPTVLVQRTLGILKTLKEEEAAAKQKTAKKKKTKASRGGGAGAESLRAEHAGNASRLEVAVRAVRQVCRLELARSPHAANAWPGEVAELARVAAEVFRHCERSEASADALALCMALVARGGCSAAPALAKDCRGAFEGVEGFALCFASARCAAACAAALARGGGEVPAEQHEWLRRSETWLAQVLVNERYLAEDGLDELAAGAGLASSGGPIPRALSRRLAIAMRHQAGDLFERRLRTFEALPVGTADAMCLEALPRGLWGVAGGSASDASRFPRLGPQSGRTLVRGLDMLRRYSLARSPADWVAVARSLGAFLCTPAKQPDQEQLVGAVCVFDEEQAAAFCGLCATLPTLPVSFLRGAALALPHVASPAVQALLLETVFGFAGVLETDALLSFAVTAALRGAASGAVTAALRRVRSARGWPLGELLGEAVRGGAAQHAGSPDWVCLAGLVADDCEDVREILEQRLAAAWADGDEVAAQQVAASLQQGSKASPMRAVAAAASPRRAMVGWIRHVAGDAGLLRDHAWGFLCQPAPRDGRLELAKLVAGEDPQVSALLAAWGGL